MKPEEDFSLTSGGDCRSHWHSEDRVPTQVFLHGLQTVAKRRVITTDTVLGGSEDYALVDSTLNNVEITLPLAVNGREVDVTKLSFENTLTIFPASGDTVMGTTDVLVYAQWTSLRFKAVSGGWILI